MKDAYAIMVPMGKAVFEPERYNYQKYSDNFAPLINQSSLTEATMLAEAARNAGLDVALIFDYHVSNPYHGCPPHATAGEFGVTSNKSLRAQGLGLAPFSWKDGWKFAQKVVEVYARQIMPDYIQQGIDAEFIPWMPPDNANWKRRWGYNDVMGMFEDGLDLAGWVGTYVVSGYYSSSLKKARGIHGTAIKDSDLLNRVVFDLPDTPVDDPVDVPPPPPPPPVDSSLEAFMAETVKTFIVMKDAIKANEARISNAESRIFDLRDDLTELEQDYDGDLDQRIDIARLLETLGGWF